MWIFPASHGLVKHGLGYEYKQKKKKILMWHKLGWLKGVRNKFTRWRVPRHGTRDAIQQAELSSAAMPQVYILKELLSAATVYVNP